MQGTIRAFAAGYGQRSLTPRRQIANLRPSPSARALHWQTMLLPTPMTSSLSAAPTWPQRWRPRLHAWGPVRRRSRTGSSYRHPAIVGRGLGKRHLAHNRCVRRANRALRSTGLAFSSGCSIARRAVPCRGRVRRPTATFIARSWKPAATSVLRRKRQSLDWATTDNY